MKRTFKSINNISKVITIVIAFILFVAVFYLMNHVQDLLNSDVKINLTEVVTQNKDVITSKLKLELNSLQMVADQMSDNLRKEGNADEGTLDRLFLEYCEGNSNISGSMYISNDSGEAFFADGRTVNIYGRKYFRLAMDGVQNVSDRVVSRVTGNEIFVFSVPLTVNNKVVGTIQHFYTPEEMYSLCSISLFSSQGYMYIINGGGYILLSTQDRDYTNESDNLYRNLYAAGNQQQAAQIETDISINSAGFMETVRNGERIFSAYTPIEEIHDWYLISSVATSAVSSNATKVFKLFYFILSVVIILFGIIILNFLAYKKVQSAKLERIAFVDPVTQGNTYNKFVVDVADLLEKQPSKPFYILSFDIDNFKYVNNYYGFDFGDRVLYQIVQNMNSRLKDNEIIARISGDHFVVLLENGDKDRINNLLDKLVLEDGVMIYISAGLYPVTDRTQSINLMVDKASTAANAAKGIFHKQVEIYSEKFEQIIMQNEQLKRKIEQALLDDELVPFYQPKVDVNTSKLVGAEALARWVTKDGNLISPAEFIPVCEKTGLIVELDMVIFEKTLKFISKCIKEGTACVPISVNFSRLHLFDKKFINKLIQLIKRYKVPPGLIEVELTESIIFGNMNIIADFTSSLHKHGLLISMDDFGSGYSSLNMLKDIPIDVLKIDREFLKETSDNQRRNIIFSSIAQMANRLNIKVVVEGVENNENVELMKKCGCDIAQGYYFARPMNENEFQQIYKEGRV